MQYMYLFSRHVARNIYLYAPEFDFDFALLLQSRDLGFIVAIWPLLPLPRPV
jgi:hypothetical protein